MSNPDTSSAEWIAEAPSQCDGSGSCQPLPLADFGTVQFTGPRRPRTVTPARSPTPPGRAAPIALGSNGTYDVSYGSRRLDRRARRRRRCPRTARRSRSPGSRTAPTYVLRGGWLVRWLGRWRLRQWRLRLRRLPGRLRRLWIWWRRLWLRWRWLWRLRLRQTATAVATTAMDRCDRYATPRSRR